MQEHERSVKPEHVRAAMQSAAGKGLKFPSVEFEEYVAAYLSRMGFLHG
jgi:hypothetical protein